jgi:hypothetical protein
LVDPLLEEMVVSLLLEEEMVVGMVLESEVVVGIVLELEMVVSMLLEETVVGWPVEKEVEDDFPYHTNQKKIVGKTSASQVG